VNAAVHRSAFLLVAPLSRAEIRRYDERLSAPTVPRAPVTHPRETG